MMVRTTAKVGYSKSKSEAITWKTGEDISESNCYQQQPAIYKNIKNVIIEPFKIERDQNFKGIILSKEKKLSGKFFWAIYVIMNHLLSGAR